MKHPISPCLRAISFNLFNVSSHYVFSSSFANLVVSVNTVMKMLCFSRLSEFSLDSME